AAPRLHRNQRPRRAQPRRLALQVFFFAAGLRLAVALRLGAAAFAFGAGFARVDFAAAGFAADLAVAGFAVADCTLTDLALVVPAAGLAARLAAGAAAALSLPADFPGLPPALAVFAASSSTASSRVMVAGSMDAGMVALTFPCFT